MPCGRGRTVPADDGRLVTLGSYLAHTGFEFVPRLGLSQHRLGSVDRLGGQAGQLVGSDVAVGQAADLVGVADGDIARPHLLLHFGGQGQLDGKHFETAVDVTY